MSQSPITVTYSLEEVLGEIKQSIKEVNQKLDNIQIGQARLEEEIKSLKEDVKETKDTQKTLVNDVADLKGTKSLIIPIIVAVTTSLLTLLIRTIPNP